MNTVEALKIEETGKYLVKLIKGTYKIDGKITTITSDQEVQVDSLDNIFKMGTKSAVTHYVNIDTGELSVDKYNEELQKLAAKGKYDEDTYSQQFVDLDDEYAYKKFKRNWNAVTKLIYISESEILFEEQSVQLSTGNQFISSVYAVSGQLSDVYIYNKSAAQHSTFLRVVKELGLENSENIGKTWSNATHSGIRYAKIGSKYIFNNSYGEKNVLRGGLEFTTKMCESDILDIETKVKAQYNLLFGNSSYDAQDVLTGIKNVVGTLNRVESKVKTQGDLRSAINALIKVEESLLKQLAENK